MSEEESSSLINILDRKKYNERIQATRSADDQNQPSFFEKISTGSNTDSDLRVVRFDGSAAKEIDSADAFKYEDPVPRFRKPVPSKYQLSQQQMVNDAANQRRIQQQQLLLFEDFPSEQEGRSSIDMMNMGELYQHKQQQSLQAYLGQTNFLSEDRISQPPQTETVANQSMASTQDASVFLGPANEDSPKSAAKRLEQKAESPAESIYEK